MDWTNPHFAEPRWLWLAVLGPALLLVLFWHSGTARSRQLKEVAAQAALSRLTRSHSPARRAVKNGLLIFAAFCIGIALARPQWGELSEKGQTLGHDVLFVMDCSRSMLATDVSPNRLERARLAILDFMKGGNLGRVGLITFAGQAFIQCPLTFDYGAFQETLNTVDDKSIPIMGTDIGRALDEAFRASENREGPRIVVLITDGEDLEKGAVAKAEQLGKQNLVVFAIGVGTPAGSEVRILGEQGRFELLRDQNGEVVVSRLDESTLRKVAAATGGSYFGLGSMGEGLMRVQSLLRDESSKMGLTPVKKLGVDRFHFPLAAAVLFLAAESLIGTRRKRREIVE